MATSGSFDTTHRISGSYNTYAHFAWSQTGQSTANNTTSIDWTFSGRTASQYQYVYVYGASVTVDGSTKSGWSGNMYNGTQMLSGSKTITHTSDGTKTFSASGYVTQYSSNSNYSGSGSWTLTTIPRKATLKTYPDFNDEDNPTITYENKAGTSVSTLQACISLTGSADDIAYRDINKTGTSYTFNLTQAERNVLLNATKTSKTRKVSFFIKTVIGGNTFYDSKEVTFSVVNANPTFSNFTYADTNSTTTAITGNNQYIIQGKSTLRATIASANKATANKSATMVQYDFAIAGYAGIEAYATSDINKDIGVINASVDQALQVVARDSRDNTTTVQKTVYMVPYASPSIIATATRQANFESNTTIHISGAMSLLSVAGVTKNAVNASNGIKWRYKESTSSTWGSWTNVASTTSADGTVSVTDFVRTFDNKKAWDLQFSITDKLETKTINVSVGQGQPQFFIGSDGRVAVGGLPSLAKTLSANGGQLEIIGSMYGTLCNYDTRDTNELPSYYLGIRRGITNEFKRIDVIDNPFTSGTFCNLITVAQWHNESGGLPMQIAISGSDIAVRKATSTTVWGNWEKIKRHIDGEDWQFLGKAVNTSTVTNGMVLSVAIPSEYQNCSLRVLVKYELSADGWVDLRSYNSSGTLLQHTINSINSVSGTATNQGLVTANYILNTESVSKAYICANMQATSFKLSASPNFRSWVGQSGNGYQIRNISALQKNADGVASLRLYTGGTAESLCVMKVWGMLD